MCSACSAKTGNASRSSSRKSRPQASFSRGSVSYSSWRAGAERSMVRAYGRRFVEKGKKEPTDCGPWALGDAWLSGRGLHLGLLHDQLLGLIGRQIEGTARFSSGRAHIQVSGIGHHFLEHLDLVALQHVAEVAG